MTVQLVDERQAAEMLSLTPRTMQEWRASGRGPPHVRISSRCVRYRVRDLEAWIEGRLRASTADQGEAIRRIREVR